MKRLIYITAILITAVIFISGCKDKKKPGSIYMPDMTYSRAYESYAEKDTTVFTMNQAKRGGSMIYYNNSPVNGTIKRGELYPYMIPNDIDGYLLSATVKNPIDSLSKADLAEAGRLYNINCAICHGEKALGNGPIATSGKIGGIANLTLDMYVKMADGTMFHSITYGRNLMGSYASQLDRKQRWMLVKYIRSLQPKAEAGGAATTAAADTTVKKG